MPGHYMAYQMAISGDKRSPQDRNIQPAQGPVGQSFSPQDMNIQPAPSPSTAFSPQDMNIQPASSPSTAFSPQDMNIPPAGSGITTLTSGSGTDDSSDNKDEQKIIDKFGRFMAFGKPVRNLTDLELNQILEQVKLYQKGLPNYFEGFPGGLNFAKGIADSITQGEIREDGTPTLQGLKKFIREEIDPDSNILDSFKEAAPATYLDVFGLPATDAGLDFFANLSLDDDEFDKETQQKIIEARERLQDARSREAQNMGQGIMAASPALPGVSVPAGGTVSSPAVIPNPVLSPVPVGGITPTTTGMTPFNINQFYASLPQYTQQGIMAPTNLSRFTDALRMFPGATV